MKKKLLQLTIGLLISAFFIWFAFKTGGVTLAQVGEAFARVNWLWAVPMMALTMASFYWRCFRWRILLAPKRDVPSRRLYGPLMIGFAFNNLFPARAGEIARPLALYKQERVPIGTGLSSIVVERLVDVLTLLLLLLTMPLYVRLDPTISREFNVGDTVHTINAAWFEAKLPLLSIAAGILMIGLASFLVPAIKDLYIRLLHLMRFIPVGIRNKLESFVESFVAGCAALRSPRSLGLIAFHSLVIWGSVAFSFQMMSWGFPGISINFGQALAFLVVTCLIISIPSSPGFWGLYEFGGMVALLMMGVVADSEQGGSDAFAFTLVVHALQWIPITLYGLWAASTLSLSADEVDAVAETTATGDEPAPGPATGAGA
jgi:uncharacterized protein (TIRG00374 family)